ncbi:MAG: SMI1/KNR4 family protein [Muribaculum sp.]|nr:SMI1/KNR4 family protein [Muribaculum sp.]
MRRLMKYTKKTWMETALCAAALLLGACGKEEAEPVGDPGVQSEPKIKVAADAGEEAFWIDEATAVRIESVEEYCNAVFPTDYLDFIARHNVYEPEDNTFQIDGETYVIDRFLGFVEENSPLDEYDIMMVLSPIDLYLISDPDSSGLELIPVASLSTGDYVCLNFAESRENPSVCVLDCGKSEELHPVVYRAADTFSDFIAGLESAGNRS